MYSKNFLRLSDAVLMVLDDHIDGLLKLGNINYEIERIMILLAHVAFTGCPVPPGDRKRGYKFCSWNRLYLYSRARTVCCLLNMVIIIISLVHSLMFSDIDWEHNRIVEPVHLSKKHSRSDLI